MLGSIHDLAAAGKTNEYLVLKAEFDEIDKGNVAVSRESLSNLLARVSHDGSNIIIPDDINEAVNTQTSEPVVRESVYKSLSVTVLAEMVEDLGYRRSINGEDVNDQQIRDILAASNYHEDVAYAAVYSNGLPYAEQIQLADDHAPSLYHGIVKTYGEEVFKKDKAGFLKALEKLENKPDKTSTDKAQAEALAKDLAVYGNSEQDLYIAERNVNYGVLGSRVSTDIASNQYLNKELAIRILTSEANTGAQNYQSARSAIRHNLATKGVLLPELAKWNSNPSPLVGFAPEKLQATLAVLKASKENDFQARDKKTSVQALIDAHAENREALLQEFKRVSRRNASRHEVELAYDFKLRISASTTYLNYVNDLPVIRAEIAKAEF
jgi:hypothetical protein